LWLLKNLIGLAINTLSTETLSFILMYFGDYLRYKSLPPVRQAHRGYGHVCGLRLDPHPK
jgi:hypothetical protein